MQLDFLFKQALVAIGLLASTLTLGQTSVLAVTPESENAPSTSLTEELLEEGAIAATQPAKTWQVSDSLSIGTPIQLAQAEEPAAVEPMEGMDMAAPAPSEEPASPSITQTIDNPEPSEPTTEPTFDLDEDSTSASDLVTRYRFSYIGIGPNVGITGDPAIGDTSFAIVSRISVAPAISLRPAVFIEDDASFLLPVTYDFPISGPGEVAPYVGGGVVFDTGDDSSLDLLLSAGLDIPLNDNFAVTTGVNAAPFDEFDLGLFFAVAYTFGEVTTTEEPLDVNATLSDTGAAVSQAASDAGLSDRRNNPSFVGIGANLGIGGDTALGDTSFAVLSKITVAPSVSVRPSLLIEDGVSVLLPVTYDFDGFSTEFISFYPFIGAGAAFSFEDDDDELDLLLTGGVDIPITSNLAFTTSINAGLLDSFDIGALLGVVYTFSSF